jgi:hypothetical protein
MYLWWTAIIVGNQDGSQEAVFEEKMDFVLIHWFGLNILER